MLRVLVTSLALAFLTKAAAQPVQERRVALVIGVTDYDSVANLTNPRVGARRVYEALRATGFDVPEPLDSPTKAELDAALQLFSRRADTADVAVLYFAGHGMQQFDDNWLIPRSATLARPSDIVLEGVPLQNVVRLMAGARLRLIFLDACRNNPFSARWPTTMSPADGLAELGENAVPAGTVLAYSAGPRQLAPDNGVFARALADHMQREGLELRQVLDRVRRDVTQVSPNLNPTHTIALNTAPFYFRSAPATPLGTTAAVPPSDPRLDAIRALLAPVSLAGEEPSEELHRTYRETVSDSVFFNFQEATLTPEAQSMLDQQARWLLANPRVRVRIYGNADLREREDAVMLGAQRAKSVRDYLIGAGVPAERVGATTYGLDRPLMSPTDEAAWAMARRVETRLVSVATTSSRAR